MGFQAAEQGSQPTGSSWDDRPILAQMLTLILLEADVLGSQVFYIISLGGEWSHLNGAKVTLRCRVRLPLPPVLGVHVNQWRFVQDPTSGLLCCAG